MKLQTAYISHSSQESGKTCLFKKWRDFFRCQCVLGLIYAWQWTNLEMEEDELQSLLMDAWQHNFLFWYAKFRLFIMVLL